MLKVKRLQNCHTNILSENSEYLRCSLAMMDAIIQMVIINLFFK
jgi:hypothetical protein